MMTEKHDAFVWWIDANDAANLKTSIIEGGANALPDDLKGVILARAEQTAEPQVWTILVAGLKQSDLEWSADIPACNEAIKQSGIVFPRSLAPYISDLDVGFVTDQAFNVVDVHDLANEAAVAAIYDAKIPLTLTDMTPEESAARTAAARERDHDYTPKQRKLIEAARFINDGPPTGSKPKM